MSSVHEIYRDARDRLVALHGDPEKAVADFEWPVLHGAFQWAHDWFDVIADGESRTALHIVEEDGGEGSWSFDELRGEVRRPARRGHGRLGRRRVRGMAGLARRRRGRRRPGRAPGHRDR